MIDDIASPVTPDIEKKYVHGVYDAIAPHFSSTRFAKWPKVACFLESLVPGSLVVDAGCGNGKYLGLNPQCFFVGCDLSSPLVSICSERGSEVLVADTLRLPYRTGSFDAAISIAVLHHLSTEERRRKAVEELARVVAIGGSILITVWAVEQEDKTLLSKWTPLTSKYSAEWVGIGVKSKSSKQLVAPLQSIEEQDILVGAAYDDDILKVAEEPTSMTESFSMKGTEDNSAEQDILVGAAYDDDILKWAEEPSTETIENFSMKGTEDNSAEQQDFFVPWHLPYHRAEIAGASAAAVASGFARKDDKKAAVIYNRYYHVFAEGELERLVSRVKGVRILDKFFDKSNWCVILQRA